MSTVSIPGMSRTRKTPGAVGTVSLGVGPVNSEDQPRRLLLAGNKLTSGTLTVDAQYVRVSSPDEVDTYCGAGSELACMAYKALLVSGIEVWIAASAEGGSAVAATGTITFSGTSTASGTLRGRIGGQPFELPIDASTSATAAGAALVAKIAENLRSPVTGGNSSGTVTLTSKSKGVRANQLSVYIDQTDMPAGLTAAVSGGSALPTIGLQTGCRFTGGSVVDDITNLVAVLKSVEFDTIVGAHIDSTNVGRWKTHCATMAAISSSTKFTMYVVGQTGTYSTALAVSDAINDAFGQIVHCEELENAPSELAAAAGAARQKKDQEHPNKSFWREPLLGLAPLVSPTSIPLESEIETSLSNGITPCVSDGELIRLVESITTHHLTAVGSGIYDYRTFYTGQARTSFRVYEKIKLLWETEYQPANEHVRDDLPNGKEPPQGVATPRLWKNAIMQLLLGLEDLFWIVDVGVGLNTVDVTYDRIFRGLTEAVNIEVYPIHNKTGLNVRQRAS